MADYFLIAIKQYIMFSRHYIYSIKIHYRRELNSYKSTVQTLHTAVMMLFKLASGLPLQHCNKQLVDKILLLSEGKIANLISHQWHRKCPASPFPKPYRMLALFNGVTARGSLKCTWNYDIWRKDSYKLYPRHHVV